MFSRISMLRLSHHVYRIALVRASPVTHSRNVSSTIKTNFTCQCRMQQTASFSSSGTFFDSDKITGEVEDVVVQNQTSPRTKTKFNSVGVKKKYPSRIKVKSTPVVTDADEGDIFGTFRDEEFQKKFNNTASAKFKGKQKRSKSNQNIERLSEQSAKGNNADRHRKKSSKSDHQKEKIARAKGKYKKQHQENPKFCNTFGTLDNTYRLRHSYLKSRGGAADDSVYEGLTRDQRVIVADEPNLPNETFAELDAVKRIGGLRKNSRLIPGSEGKKGHLPLAGNDSIEGAPEEDRDWSDTFGTLSADANQDIEKQMKRISGQAITGYELEEDEKDARPYMRLSETGRRYTPGVYARRIRELGKQNKIAEAIDVLEVDMLQTDRVKPTSDVFIDLLAVLGRVGYMSMAFKMFKKMLQFGIEAKHYHYTSLFNSCANCPPKFRREALERAIKLRSVLKDRGYELSTITYKAMVKAFAITGDLRLAFASVDEMMEKGHPVDAEVFSGLLMAAVADEKSGFTLAYQIWRQMLIANVKPDIFHYNLFLRTVRDCSIGTNSDFEQLMTLGSTPIQRNLIRSKGNRKSLSSGGDQTQEVLLLNEKSAHETEVLNLQNDNQTAIACQTPNLFVPGSFKDVVSIGEMKYPQDRLALVGGVQGMVAMMKHDNANPDIKTFTTMLDCIPLNTEDETNFLEVVKSYNIKLDVGFYNKLMRKRTKRGDMQSALAVMEMMTEHGLKPDISTFGTLATGCKKKEQGLSLLKGIEDSGLQVTPVIFNILAGRALQDFSYKMALCSKMTEAKLEPSEKFLQLYERDLGFYKEILLKRDRGVPLTDKEQHLIKKYKGGFDGFVKQYTTWLRSMGIHRPEHPYAKFRKKEMQSTEEK